MFIVIVVMAGIVLFTAITVGVLPLYEMYHSNNSQVIAGEIASIQQAVNNHAGDDLDGFYLNGYAYPSSVSGARMSVSKQEYRDLYFLSYDRYKHIETNFNYINTGDSSRPVKSHRFAMWFESPFGNFLGNDYTKAGSNKCGVGDVLTANFWCGNAKSLWAKLESHTGHFGLIQSEQHRLYRLSRKFYRYYESKGSFAGLGAGFSPLASYVDGGILAGGPEINKVNCSGVYNLDGIPLGCQDMFNAWGGAIYLHATSADNIAFTNSLGIELVQPDGANRKYVGLAEEININELLSEP